MTLRVAKGHIWQQIATSYPSKVDFVAGAGTAGYQIILVVVHLENAASPFERVAVLKQQTPVFLADPLPDWASDLQGE